MPGESAQPRRPQSAFLAARGPEAQLHIAELAEAAAQSLDRWAARFPIVRRVRIPPLALSVAAAAPFASVEAIVSTARLSLWVFTLDDVFDEETWPEAELMAQAERYRAIAHAGPTATGDAARLALPDASLAAALGEVRADLAGYPLFGSLGGEWARALGGTIDGMIQEYSWRRAYRSRGAAALPAYADYVSTGLYSIGGPPHIWAALIAADDPSTPRHLQYLREMLRTACICIRLANDLRSHPKELDEGNVNSLVILEHSLREQNLSKADAQRRAREHVLNDIARALSSLNGLKLTPRTQTGRPESAIADIASFVCEFYSEHDYHTFTSEHQNTRLER